MTEDLPPGWQTALDPATAVRYYFNPSTRTTQWEHPGAAPPQPPQLEQPSPSDTPDGNRPIELSDEAASHRSAAAVLLKAAAQQGIDDL